jgi:Ser-tRNA(Ala) deacylase AlaX
LGSQISFNLIFTPNAPSGSINEPLTKANFEGNQALESLAKSKLVNPTFQQVPSSIDATASMMETAEGVYQGVATLNPIITPLGQTLSSLSRLVEIIDGVSEVSCFGTHVYGRVVLTQSSKDTSDLQSRVELVIVSL